MNREPGEATTAVNIIYPGCNDKGQENLRHRYDRLERAKSLPKRLQRARFSSTWHQQGNESSTEKAINESKDYDACMGVMIIER